MQVICLSAVTKLFIKENLILHDVFYIMMLFHKSLLFQVWHIHHVKLKEIRWHDIAWQSRDVYVGRTQQNNTPRVLIIFAYFHPQGNEFTLSARLSVGKVTAKNHSLTLAYRGINFSLFF